MRVDLFGIFSYMLCVCWRPHLRSCCLRRIMAADQRSCWIPQVDDNNTLWRQNLVLALPAREPGLPCVLYLPVSTLLPEISRTRLLLRAALKGIRFNRTQQASKCNNHSN